MSASIVHGKYVISKVDGPTSAVVIRNGAVYQESGRIVEVGVYQQLKEKHPLAETVGSPDHIVMPGLVNSHDHIGISGVQLGIPYPPLELNGLARIGIRSVDPYLEHLHGAIQMLESGTTTVQIMYTPGRGVAPIDEESTQKVIKAYQDAGVRLCYAPNLQDQNSLVASPRGGEQEFARQLPGKLGTRFSAFMGQGYWTVDELVSASEDLYKKYHKGNNGRTVINTAPTNVHRCSDGLLKGLKELTEKYRTTSHIHLLETVYQKLFALRIYGTTAVKHLEEIGFLGPDVTCGHSVWLTEEDVDVLCRTGTNVCHNASSNLRVQSGIAPIPHLVDKGIRVAIGTDNMSMNDDKDMFQEMRLVLYIHRLPGVEFDPITSHQVFQMATINGALSTGFGDSIGTIEEGKRADMVLVNANRVEEPYLDPDVSIVTALVQRVRGVDVDTVIVDGEIVLKDGQVTRVDKVALFREMKNSLDRPLTHEEAERRKLGQDVYPYLKAFYSGSTGEMPPPFSQYNAR
ncbi:MAG: amidohydrolase family protein [Chloroflexi bacterium]|nr:amidohydrolase family protein [Chloroflexota bacterium]